jgi:hypothetical protein
VRRPTALPNEDQRRRFSPFRIRTLYAVLWLALVAGLSIYDHQRAIGREVQSRLPENTAEFVIRWLTAPMEYTGEAIAFYGLLPLGITFVLFVLFLPWAVPWAQGGGYEE